MLTQSQQCFPLLSRSTNLTSKSPLLLIEAQLQYNTFNTLDMGTIVGSDMDSGISGAIC